MKILKIIICIIFILHIAACDHIEDRRGEPADAVVSITATLPKTPSATETPQGTDSSPQQTENPPVEDIIEYDNEWAFYLINPENRLPDDFTVELVNIGGRFDLDVRVAEYALRMIADAKDDGLELIVAGAYRSIQRQRELFESRVNALKQAGHSADEAHRLTALEYALPGASEHNAGLAIDILSNSHPNPTRAFDQSAEFEWLINNCFKYGFILRYPDEKTHITGIMYEPWHYRFVGVQRAHEIHESGLTLEEFILALE